jgi:tetratricopeptide (TPR) repeat protein
VGVDSELQQISRRLTGLAARRPGLAFGLWGEPGIGKTHAALTLLRGAPCQSFTVHATQALEGIINAIPHPKKASIWLERSLERLERGEPQEIGTLIQTIVALLTANAPVILHVEDLHEAGEERLEFWKQLALVVTRTRGVGLIITSRTEPPGGFETIRLSALNREASDALLEAEAGAALPREALTWVFERALGNPLFTLEFFRFLARQGFLWNDNHRWRWRVPENKAMPVTVEALIERMLREATGTPTLQDAINAKAVLGLGANTALWAEVAGLTPDALREAMLELEREGVLSGGEFAHPLYAEVTAHNLPPAQRQTLARRAIQALKDDPESAAQFVSDAELEPLAALELLERAALQVKKLGNEALAGQLLAKAVYYAVGKEKGNLALEAAKILRFSDEKTSLYLSKLACETLDDATEAIYTHASILAFRGNLSDAEEMLLRLSPGKHDSIRWLEELIGIKLAARDGKGVIELWNQHPETREQCSISTLIRVSSALMRCDKVEEALSMAFSIWARPDVIPQERDELRYIAGTCYHLLDQAELAVEMFQDCISFLRTEHRPQRLINVLNACSAALAEINRHQEALACLNEALEVAAVLGNPLSYACTQYILGDLLVTFGEFVKAEELLLESRTLLLQLNPGGALVDCEMFLSNLYQVSELPYSSMLSERHALFALKTAQLTNHSHYINAALRSLAAAENCNGRPEKGLALAKQILLTVKPQRLWDLRETYFVYAQSLVALGRTGEALTAFQIAEKAAKQIGELYKAHLIGLELDHLKHDLESARVRLQWFEERGLMSGANIACRYFPELAQDRLSRDASKLEPKSLARLGVLGPMQLRIESVITPLRGGTRKELLALLLEARIRGRSEVTSLDLCDALYPLEPEEAALGALRATIFKIRSSLGTDLIATTPNGYALGPVASDAETFLQTGDTSLWRGPYLEDAGLEGRDENVREALHRALEMRARALLEGDTPIDPQEAARLGRILLRAEPYDVGALELTCRALRASDNHKGLSRLYADARARMLEVGERLPETWQAFLSPVTSG